ncbi:unnamed protein product [Vitrella brassicaformis CCMP3155]|uniref:HTH CENPB-type domain-containing protein n=1 Tax=Vitrella brassicaformis (strain CCMP3155) TaxID=1169540 RepID=A0A0G4EYA2_VITBC|nr:unnamed protein product [Vitrella brassicaformis CCMP3155]|eukprot:CEM03614.1 unnamed protein product [Vitrella brassicaformis CCMP3155]
MLGSEKEEDHYRWKLAIVMRAQCAPIMMKTQMRGGGQPQELKSIILAAKHKYCPYTGKLSHCLMVFQVGLGDELTVPGLDEPHEQGAPIGPQTPIVCGGQPAFSSGVPATEELQAGGQPEGFSLSQPADALAAQCDLSEQQPFRWPFDISPAVPFNLHSSAHSEAPLFPTLGPQEAAQGHVCSALPFPHLPLVPYESSRQRAESIPPRLSTMPARQSSQVMTKRAGEVSIGERCRLVAEFNRRKQTGEKITMPQFAQEKGIEQTRFKKWCSAIKKQQEEEGGQVWDATRKRNRKGKFPELEVEMWKWLFGHQDSAAIPPKLIRAKALEIAGQLRIDGFSASDSWITAFKRRCRQNPPETYEPSAAPIAVASSRTDVQPAQAWMGRLPCDVEASTYHQSTSRLIKQDPPDSQPLPVAQTPSLQLPLAAADHLHPPPRSISYYPTPRTNAGGREQGLGHSDTNGLSRHRLASSDPSAAAALPFPIAPAHLTHPHHLPMSFDDRAPSSGATPVPFQSDPIARHRQVEHQMRHWMEGFSLPARVAPEAIRARVMEVAGQLGIDGFYGDSWIAAFKQRWQKNPACFIAGRNNRDTSPPIEQSHHEIAAAAASMPPPSKPGVASELVHALQVAMSEQNRVDTVSGAQTADDTQADGHTENVNAENVNEMLALTLDTAPSHRPHPHSQHTPLFSTARTTDRRDGKVGFANSGDGEFQSNSGDFNAPNLQRLGSEKVDVTYNSNDWLYGTCTRGRKAGFSGWLPSAAETEPLSELLGVSSLVVSLQSLASTVPLTEPVATVMIENQLSFIVSTIHKNRAAINQREGEIVSQMGDDMRDLLMRVAPHVGECHEDLISALRRLGEEMTDNAATASSGLGDSLNGLLQSPTGSENVGWSCEALKAVARWTVEQFNKSRELAEHGAPPAEHKVAKPAVGTVIADVYLSEQSELLLLRCDDQVLAMHTDGRGWMYGRCIKGNMKGHSGWFLSTIVTFDNNPQASPSSSTAASARRLPAAHRTQEPPASASATMSAARLFDSVQSPLSITSHPAPHPIAPTGIGRCDADAAASQQLQGEEAAFRHTADAFIGRHRHDEPEGPPQVERPPPIDDHSQQPPTVAAAAVDRQSDHSRSRNTMSVIHSEDRRTASGDRHLNYQKSDGFAHFAKPPSAVPSRSSVKSVVSITVDDYLSDILEHDDNETSLARSVVSTEDNDSGEKNNDSGATDEDDMSHRVIFGSSLGAPLSVWLFTPSSCRTYSANAASRCCTGLRVMVARFVICIAIPPVAQSEAEYRLVNASYRADRGDGMQLTVKKGDAVQVFLHDPSGWTYGELSNGNCGWFSDRCLGKRLTGQPFGMAAREAADTHNHHHQQQLQQSGVMHSTLNPRAKPWHPFQGPSFSDILMRGDGNGHAGDAERRTSWPWGGWHGVLVCGHEDNTSCVHAERRVDGTPWLLFQGLPFSDGEGGGGATSAQARQCDEGKNNDNGDERDRTCTM